MELVQKTKYMIKTVCDKNKTTHRNARMSFDYRKTLIYTDLQYLCTLDTYQWNTGHSFLKYYLKNNFPKYCYCIS